MLRYFKVIDRVQKNYEILFSLIVKRKILWVKLFVLLLIHVSPCKALKEILFLLFKTYE